jgi:hypothetical protein
MAGGKVKVKAKAKAKANVKRSPSKYKSGDGGLITLKTVAVMKAKK